MKAKFTELAENQTLLEYTDPFTGERVSQEIRAPINGGYVTDEKFQQVCEGLYSTGHTLIWSGKYPLVDLVRREWKRRQNYNKQDKE